MSRNMSSSFRLFVSTLLFLSPTLAAQAQSNRSAACVGKAAWVVDGAGAIPIGKCDGDWVAPLRVGQWKYPRKSGATSRARKVLALLQAAGKEQSQPTALPGSELERKLPRLKRQDAISVDINLVPPHAREFFERAETSPPSMVFAVTIGTKYPKGYDEFDRFLVRVPGTNPAVGEVLRALLEMSAGFTYPTSHEEGLYLARPWVEEEMDNSKTVADYQLKNGSVLWLFSRYR